MRDRINMMDSNVEMRPGRMGKRGVKVTRLYEVKQIVGGGGRRRRRKRQRRAE